ncbi:hypothetical protein BpHYR1_027250 [Brachionus plicatilis]|uniref:Uncharacterized protein n=1 Tax=Brachionus plicatilis TaxID=10195 RepID=A0A3M7P7D0_BRAPC|nr:hypothetical protein BpHYR1_027250 [Brachionus plicatilis]
MSSLVFWSSVQSTSTVLVYAADAGHLNWLRDRWLGAACTSGPTAVQTSELFGLHGRKFPLLSTLQFTLPLNVVEHVFVQIFSSPLVQRSQTAIATVQYVLVVEHYFGYLIVLSVQIGQCGEHIFEHVHVQLLNAIVAELDPFQMLEFLAGLQFVVLEADIDQSGEYAVECQFIELVEFVQIIFVHDQIGQTVEIFEQTIGQVFDAVARQIKSLEAGEAVKDKLCVAIELDRIALQTQRLERRRFGEHEIVQFLKSKFSSLRAGKFCTNFKLRSSLRVLLKELNAFESIWRSPL